MPRVSRKAQYTLEYSRPIDRKSWIRGTISRTAWIFMGGRARERATKVRFAAEVLIFSVSTGISCIRKLSDPIRWFWHFRNALPRSRNVYCKILLPPLAPPPIRSPAQQPRVYVTLRDAPHYYTKQEQCVPQLHRTATLCLHCDLFSPFSHLLFTLTLFITLTYNRRISDIITKFKVPL
jgi:hypothetical protein